MVSALNCDTLNSLFYLFGYNFLLSFSFVSNIMNDYFKLEGGLRSFLLFMFLFFR